MTCTVDRSLLLRCVRGLVNASPQQLVRLSLSRAAGEGAGHGHLALVTYDERGWWEHNRVAALVREPFEPAECVVRLRELAVVLKTSSDRLEAVEPEVAFEERGVVVDGTMVATAPDDELVPHLPNVTMPVEDFGVPDEAAVHASPVSIETQVGRLGLGVDLVRHFAERGITEGRVVEAEDAPYVSAETTIPVLGTASPTVLGEVDVLRQRARRTPASGPLLEERRDARGDEVAQLLMATSPTTPAEDLLRVLDVGVGYVRRRVAAHARLPGDVINTISREGTEALRAAAAGNPSLPEEAARLLHQDESASVRAALAGNHACPEALLAALGSDPVPEVRAGAAGNPKTPVGLLEQLARDADPVVREGAGRNVAMSTETLCRLASDSDRTVCAAVAGNPLCPPDMLQELGHVLPQVVLANPSAPARLLATGAAASDPDLRLKVARNPATPAEILQEMSGDPDDHVLAAIVEHEATPPLARRRIEQRLAARAGADAPTGPARRTRGFAPRPGPRESSTVATTNGHGTRPPAP